MMFTADKLVAGRYYSQGFIDRSSLLRRGAYYMLVNASERKRREAGARGTTGRGKRSPRA